jgi:molybdenum cofactor synthesis domain-containing protein
VRLSFECDSQNYSVTVYCECALTGKTGVEMEALAGVNGALLAIYDLSKAVNPVLSMTDIRLELKEGGKQGRWLHPKAEMPVPQPQPKPPRERALAGIFAATLTISDRCSKNETQDRSGPLLVDELTQRGAEVIGHAIVADEPDEIRKSVIRFVREQGAKLVITTGGTGLGPRDNTPEAVAPLWSRRLPGFGELLRAHGAKQTEMSWLSRSEAGLVGQSLVILLPGSPRAVQDAMKALEHLIPHALSIAQGGAH